MKIAIISDIHSNCYALEAVFKEIENYSIDKYIFLGDFFGYYPWAKETYKLLQPIIEESICIKGNHDQLLLSDDASVTTSSYLRAAQLNMQDLRKNYPDSLNWLKDLPFDKEMIIDGYSFLLVHGTPIDPEKGRYYPDNEIEYNWLSDNERIILMGHTHYPLLKKTGNNGIIFNPGSLGQPRDGNPMACWGLLDTDDMHFKIIRTNYNIKLAVEYLKKIGWDYRSILALNKNYSGELNL
jgi:putative phosphoesterase